MASRIIILSLLLLVFISCTSQTAKLLGGSDKEIYDSITSELAKKKTLYIFGGPRFSKVEDMLLTLQVRYPYSEYTRETYLINGDVSYRTKDYYDAIDDYKTGFFHKVGSINDIKKKMLYLIKNKKLLKSMVF